MKFTNEQRGINSSLFSKIIVDFSIVFTGGGKLIYRIIKPAIIKNTSRKMIIPLSQTGNKLQQERDITREPTSSLSAIGSKKDPSLLACETQLRAIKPSNCTQYKEFIIKYMFMVEFGPAICVLFQSFLLCRHERTKKE